MLEISQREALQDNGCLKLLKLQDTAQPLSWKKVSTNEVTCACYLASKLDIRVEWDPFHPDLVVSSPNATLAALACRVKLSLLIQIEGGLIASKVNSDNTITFMAGGERQHPILLDGQAKTP